MLKANKAGIEKVLKVASVMRKNYLSKEEAVKLLLNAGVPINDDKIVIAYSLSKTTLIDEMAEYNRYNEMNINEFYEFIGRAAEFAFEGENVPLATKIEKLLKYLFAMIKERFINPDLADDIQSESDYDEDWVDEMH